MTKINFKRIPSRNNKLGFNSKQVDQNGIPLYTYIYLGDEVGAFKIFHRGNLIAQIQKEFNVVDFINNHYVGYQNGLKALWTV